MWQSAPSPDELAQGVLNGPLSCYNTNIHKRGNLMTMIDFDIEGLKSLVYVYGSRERIITPDSWEKIICKSVNGTHIPGDIFMADGTKNNYGLNQKSIFKNFTKGHIQTSSFVQCRCPLDNETGFIGTKIIDTLVEKREASFQEFNLDKMLDVFVIHNRTDSNYNVRLFVQEQPKYEDFDFEWHDGYAYLNPDKSKKRWEGGWKMKRIKGNATYGQSCLLIKQVFDSRNCIADFTVKCDNNHDISIEEAKEIYAKAQQR
jgi:hypothetical protein